MPFRRANGRTRIHMSKFKLSYVLNCTNQLHKEDQVERWCRWYLQVNFNEVIDKHVKVFETLHPDTQTSVAAKRWPPEWYA